jgi:hypothetical protein
MELIYDDVESPREYRQKLRRAQQGEHSVNEFAATVSKYANRLGVSDAAVTDIEAGEAFLSGVTDTHTASMVRMLVGASYPGGIPLTIALVKFKQAQSDLGKSNSVEDPNVNVKKLETESDRSRRGQFDSLNRARSRSPRFPETSGNQSQYGRPHSPSVDRRSSINEKVDQLLKTREGRIQLEQFLRNPRSRSRSRSPGTCYTCNQLGHRSRDCPQNKSSLSQIKCYNCEGMGHYASKCPNPSKNASVKQLSQENATEGTPEN